MYLICFIIDVLTDPKQTEADNIQAAWSTFNTYLRKDDLKNAAQLAQEGYLSTLKFMQMFPYQDISEISSDQLAKLVSIVTDMVSIDSLTPVSPLGTILGSVQCKLLLLEDMELSEKNTRALVTVAQ